MIDIENEVISLVFSALSDAGISASIESVLNLNPSAFPTVCVEEIENASYGATADSKTNENHASVGYEINVFTNDVDAKKQKAKEIIEAINNRLIAIGFSRFSKTGMAIDNGTKYRITARYRAYVDTNNTIYRR